jgi:hypothetical protein
MVAERWGLRAGEILPALSLKVPVWSVSFLKQKNKVATPSLE